MTGLLATKFHRPPLPLKWVSRPQLVERLNAGLAFGRRVTLVSAPAGFGKTLCISEWLEKLKTPITWLSLDAADDDPGRFFTYLVAALQRVDERIGEEIEGILRAGQLPPFEIISNILVNDILQVTSRFLLVLDDFQVVQDPGILQVMQVLIDQLPPALHLVLLSREDPPLPLARLRANNLLTEIRILDLRFTEVEATNYLNQLMELSLSPAEIRALEERTEGWIVGLQLAALAMQSSQPPVVSNLASATQKPGSAEMFQQDWTDATSFVSTLSESHRYILGYLTEEVLNRQPDEIRQFLLQTSILDGLNGDLCNQVTGREDSHTLLERLYRANLFLLPLDNEGHWFRYHHLFAELLRDRQSTLHPEQTRQAYQRAGCWYAEAGMVNQAIQYALKGSDYNLAVRLIESHAMDMLMQWHLKTVEGWMRSIPPEWSAQSPRANLAFAWMHLMRGNHELAGPYLERLGVIFADPKVGQQIGKDDPALEAKWLALSCMLLNAQGHARQSLELGKKALEIVPKQDSQVLCMIYLGLANAYQQLDDYDRAVDAFKKIIQYGQVERNSIYELLGIAGLALLALQHGQYHFAFEITYQGVERIERAGTTPPITTAVYGELGVIHYQWFQLDQAHHYFLKAIQVSSLSGYSDAEIYYGVILSRLFQIKGDLQSAADEMQKVVELMKVEAPAAVQDEIFSQQVRLYLAQARLADAQGILEEQGFSFRRGFSYPDHLHEQAGMRLKVLLFISALRILLYRARNLDETGNLRGAIALADQLVDSMLQGDYIPVAIEILLLRAQMHAVLGNQVESMRDYAHALELGQSEKYISIYVEEGQPIALALEALLKLDKLEPAGEVHAKKILIAFAELRPTSFGGDNLQEMTRSERTIMGEGNERIIEPLTERELEVLRLVAQGRTYKEISERLYISLNTVRSHVKAIYAKLSVNNRTHATLVAQELRLI